MFKKTLKKIRIENAPVGRPVEEEVVIDLPHGVYTVDAPCHGSVMFIALSLLACSSSSSTGPSCSDDASAFVGTLTCADAKAPARYVRLLAGKPLAPGSLSTSIAFVRERHQQAPEATETWVRAIVDEARALEQATGLAAAEMRSTAIWRLVREQGPITKAHAELWNLQDTTLSIWSTDDEEQLALTETDIEGWIRFASLGHEVQGQRPITLSIANKADVYRTTAARFQQGDRAEQLALTSLGVVWPEVTKRWKAAPYAKQQRVIRGGVWPRPTGTGLGYVQAVIEGDLVTNAHVIHDVLGPLHFRDGDGYFTGATP